VTSTKRHSGPSKIRNPWVSYCEDHVAFHGHDTADDCFAMQPDSTAMLRLDHKPSYLESGIKISRFISARETGHPSVEQMLV